MKWYSTSLPELGSFGRQSLDLSDVENFLDLTLDLNRNSVSEVIHYHMVSGEQFRILKACDIIIRFLLMRARVVQMCFLFPA